MKLNSEQIIKALECCDGTLAGCEECPYYDKRYRCPLKQNALSLIKQLTEENEKLKKAKYIFSTVDYCSDDLAKALEENKRLADENERLNKYLDDHCPKCIYQYDGDVQEYCVLAPCGQFKTVAEFQKQIEADTARKLRKRFD